MDGFPFELLELGTAAGTSMPFAGATSTGFALFGANWVLPKWVTPFSSTQVAIWESAYAWPAAAMLSMATMLSAAANAVVFATIMSVPWWFVALPFLCSCSRFTTLNAGVCAVL